MQGNTAIAVCEKLNIWDMYRGYAESQGVLATKERMRESLISAMSSSDEPRKAILQEALDQWDDPNFIDYLTVKLIGQN